jgi:ribosome maturation protein Sdo1
MSTPSRKIEVELPAGTVDAQPKLVSIFRRIHDENAKENSRHAYYGEIKEGVLEVTLAGEWSEEAIAQLTATIATGLLAATTTR